MSEVYIVENKEAKYPSSEYDFSPDILYPEYPWSDKNLSQKKNNVYELVRNCLKESGYDSEHLNTKDWNPLGQVIKKSDTVLIKPNWVENKNKNKKVHDNLACLVTNPSVLRPIIDYVAIALQGTGRIVIADAPMQGCDLQKMFNITGYDRLFEFYKRVGLKIEISDLRKYSVAGVYNGVLSKPELTKNTFGSIIVELNSLSLHSSKDKQNPSYKVSDYTLENTKNYHSEGKHHYEVNKIALEADVIINVPKPKTHRLAGFTAACKNFVGITYEKASLPHRVVGAKECGGDTYQKKSFWKNQMEKFDEIKTINSLKGNYIKAKIFDFLTKVAYVLGFLTTKDKYRVGSWFGNDTIWRTVVDLNFLLLYADKNGKIQKECQRKILTIGDMIVCGEKSGPVGPDPKYLGLIMMSNNTLLFDYVICKIMGFSSKCFKIFNYSNVLKKFGYFNKSLDFEYLKYNSNKLLVVDFKTPKSWNFEPHPCWKDFIEKKNNIRKGM